MTQASPPVLTETARKNAHDELQGHLSGLQDRYAAVAKTNRSPALQAQARMMGSYVGNVATKAKALFKAGGSPDVTSHLPVIAAAESHLAKLGEAKPPATANAAEGTA
jgi:hypothetical protein